MDPGAIQIAEATVVLVAAITAYWQARERKVQEKRACEVISFFDPSDSTVIIPPLGIPSRSWKMPDETKQWITFDHSLEEKADLLMQIAEAEEAEKTSYTISVPTAWYEIEYGLVKGSGKTG